MRKIFRGLLILFLVVIFIELLPALFFAIAKPAQFFPTEGAWYCEELNLRLCFDDPDESYTYAEGEKIYCSWGCHPGSKWINVHCRNFYSKSYEAGEEIVSGEYVSLDENALVIHNPDENRDYTFLRLPDTQ